MDDEATPATARNRDADMKSRAAWLFVPAAVFLLHFAAVYSFVGLACAFGWQTLQLGPWALMPTVVIGLTVLAVGGLLLARPGKPQPPAPGDNPQPLDPLARTRFLAKTSRLASVLAAVGMAVVALPSLIVAGCI